VSATPIAYRLEMNTRALVSLVSLVLLVLPALGGCPDQKPPALTLTALDRTQPLRGTVEIAGQVGDLADLVSVTVSVDGVAGPPVSVQADGTFTAPIDTTGLPDGAHLVEVVAQDGARQPNRATAALAFATDNTPPALEITEVSLKAAQGAVLPVFVRATELLHEPKIRFLDQDHALYPVSATTWRALVGVSVKQAAGTFPLQVTAADAWGNTGTGTVDVVVAETPFERGGFVKLSKEQEETQKDDSKQKHDRDIREAAWAHVEPRQLWAGPALRPTAGEISSQFGKYREYSSGERSHHLGLDLENEPGTPIYAANDGEILVAESLFVMGNHVIVGHGQGVASAYSHLTDIAVQKGQRVHKGQLLGTMGSTGQSTGPHLHWEVVVSKNKISPQLWEQDSFELPAEARFVPLVLTAAAPPPAAQ
jgi:murein DD-endopeptidase MepM/ murein hydrolase activator NlpD